jgi:hypothetical protein
MHNIYYKYNKKGKCIIIYLLEGRNSYNISINNIYIASESIHDLCLFLGRISSSAICLAWLRNKMNLGTILIDLNDLQCFVLF